MYITVSQQVETKHAKQKSVGNWKVHFVNLPYRLVRHLLSSKCHGISLKAGIN